MKRKTAKDKLKASFAMAFRAVLFNYLLTAVFFFLLWYWLIPKFFPFFPHFAKYLQNLDDDGLLVAYDIFNVIGSVLSIFPGMIAAYRLSGKRKKDFLRASNGRISYAEGMRYHLTEYGTSDFIALAVVVSVFALLAVVLNGGVGKLFPLAFYLCRSLGGLLGWIAAVVLSLGSAFIGIFSAQRTWRAEHFIGE